MVHILCIMVGFAIHPICINGAVNLVNLPVFIIYGFSFIWIQFAVVIEFNYTYKHMHNKVKAFKSNLLKFCTNGVYIQSFFAVIMFLGYEISSLIYIMLKANHSSYGNCNMAYLHDIQL